MLDSEKTKRLRLAIDSCRPLHGQNAIKIIAEMLDVKENTVYHWLTESRDAFIPDTKLKLLELMLEAEK